MEIPLHESLARTLLEGGVTTMFGLVGDANVFFADSFVAGGGTFVAAVNEASAVLMALGYAGSSGKVGFATVTHGPGLANTIAPLIEAGRERAELVLIAGDTPPGVRGNLQDVDQRALIAPTGAGFEPSRTPFTAQGDLVRAVRRTQRERRPIVFNVPADLMWATVGHRKGLAVVDAAKAGRQAIRPESEALERATGLLASSRRPLVLAGAGVVDENARKAVIELADRVGAPLATTLLAKGLFRGQPNNLGVFGTMSTPVALDYITSSDCVVAFGASLNRWTGGGERQPLYQGRRMIHCDIDPAAIGGQADADVEVDVELVGDAAATARGIIELLDTAEVAPTNAASDDLRRRVAAYDPLAEHRPTAGDGMVDMVSAAIALNRALPDRRTVVMDAGRFNVTALRYLDAEGPGSLLCPWRGFGAIGMALPTAIGAAQARGDRPAILVTGDGGFMLGGLVEFNTAVREGTDLVVVVFNDQAYGAEYVQFRNRELDPQITTFAWPNFAAVAESLGGTGVTVRELSDIDRAGEFVAKRSKPVLIDVRIHPDSVPPIPH